MARSNYEYGRRKEEEVAGKLRKKGYTVTLSKRSKGASDMKATKNSRKWVVQVKSSRKKEPTVSSSDCRRLKIQATKLGATPVVAKVSKGKIKFISCRTDRKLRT